MDSANEFPAMLRQGDVLRSLSTAERAIRPRLAHGADIIDDLLLAQPKLRAAENVDDGPSGGRRVRVEGGQVRSMRDRSEIAKMMETMKSVCVGRFLIDVPAQAEVILSHERVAGFDIETVEESDEAFRMRLARRVADIEARTPQGGADGAGGMVRTHALALPGMVGRTLVFGRERTHGIESGQRIEIEWVSVEVHAHMGSLSMTLSMDHASDARAVEAEALLARLHLRAENEVPEAPGFCIGHAVFVDPLPPHKTEHIAMHLSLPGHPDLALAFTSMPGGGSDADLLESVAETDATADAEELLRVSKLRGVQPCIEPGRPSAWTLVDRRQRPRTPSLVTLAPCIAAEPEPYKVFAGTAAPGTLARTGERCPASGWWRCEEALALDATRWFPYASLLPAATFHVRPRHVRPRHVWPRHVWPRHVRPRGFAGLARAEAIQRRSTWQLVRSAAAERADKVSADPS